MKGEILIIRIEPALKEHLEKQAVRKKTTLSEYVRAAAAKISKFKTKAIV